MKKARKVTLSDHISEMLDNIPLEISIKSSCWFALNDIIHESGAREESTWDETNPKDIKMMRLLDDKTIDLAERITHHIKEHNNKLYSEIEREIIMWSNDGTQTAGTLTRTIMELLNK